MRRRVADKLCHGEREIIHQNAPFDEILMKALSGFAYGDPLFLLRMCAEGSGVLSADRATGKGRMIIRRRDAAAVTDEMSRGRCYRCGL